MTNEDNELMNDNEISTPQTDVEPNDHRAS